MLIIIKCLMSYSEAQYFSEELNIQTFDFQQY